jgi:hypothetical protein
MEDDLDKLPIQDASANLSIEATEPHRSTRKKISVRFWSDSVARHNN